MGVTRCRVQGLDCPNCAGKLEEEIRSLPGVKQADLQFSLGTLDLEYSGDLQPVIDAARRHGVILVPEGARETAPEKTGIGLCLQSRSAAMLSAGLLLTAGTLMGWWSLDFWAGLCWLLAIGVGGWPVARLGLSALKRRDPDINLLMTVAVIGAVAIGEWAEGATVVFLFSLGNHLESLSMDRTRKSVRELARMVPHQVLVRKNGNEFEIPAAALQPGDCFIVRAGERLAADGRVVAGISSVDQAPVTGESVPVLKEPGSEVFAGTINGEGVLEVSAVRTGAEATLARIGRMVEEAQKNQAPTQRTVDRFARYYTPLVMGSALLLALLPPLLFGGAWRHWFYQSLALLVVSCPCALVISTPVAIVSSIGQMARHGVLVKGGAYLEALGRLKALAFDKTGTVTVGRPAVRRTMVFQGEEQQLLQAAVSIESHDGHPLAGAITAYGRAQRIDPQPVENVRSIPGRGITGTTGGVTYRIGHPSLFSKLELEGYQPDLNRLYGAGMTVVLIGDDCRLLGAFGLSDPPRLTTPAAFESLRKQGMTHFSLLTGDNRAAAEAAAVGLRFDAVHAGLLPGEKAVIVQELKSKYGEVAMIGDGINDAPALAHASVGVAMGGAGNDTALESAQIVLMQDDLSQLPYAVGQSRRALGVIRQNILISLLIKLVFYLLAFSGRLSLWLAVAGDMGGSLLVTLNALRLMRPNRQNMPSGDHIASGLAGKTESPL